MYRRIIAVAITVAGSFATGSALAAPTGFLGEFEGDVWSDRHDGYPRTPSGESQLRATFGPPCSSDSHANSYLLVAQDDGHPYRVNFHRMLGGASSSNLDNDVPGHMHKSGTDARLRRGIYGYICRTKRTSSSEYSAHAWGVAVDINTASEQPGSACRTIPNALGSIWTSHGWTWGKSWNDCMHFQFVSNY